MAYSVQKSAVVKIVGVSLVMLLAACSSDQRYKRQVSGDESYLESPALAGLQSPSGMILPVQNGTYDIRLDADKGLVGKALDIRPPSQPLALLNGSRGQFVGDTATLLVENNPANSGLWARVAGIVQQKGYTIASRDDAHQSLTTDWISFERLDEDVQYKGRYQIGVQSQGYQSVLTVKSLGLQQGDSPVAESSQVQRYTVSMMNSIASSLDKAQADSEAARASRMAGMMDVQSGADDTGLPLLVVRGPYTVVWDRLPNVLERVGMKVGDRSRPQGTVEVKYRSLSSSGWDALGVKDPDIKDGDYKIQVGDLDNRTSLQFIDSKGQPLTQAKNDALVSVFQSAFNRISSK
ncbi:outer membrane protein assembly factor BamC [Enterobacillus tribolii]|uniref:Outer membrane protein assembly factor BamC n=1 Tax=Enterobacillus tribolii TaxID=1487935 RepID=A0A370QRW4_9GAMM|nr:outer membrane protein assembly factor BamC [Enterobacillus tribolii]MBW7983504.1 outer membrane protein assembly factor BamC [Enterobacillus tribolii]RDK91998.1 Beta-barrel assembly machine subunit BamC [Enterobacillus tribolii]